MCAYSSLLSILLACSDTPQCVPGRTVACPCVPVGQGIQRCAEDGSRFLECECGHSMPTVKGINGPQGELNIPRKNKNSHLSRASSSYATNNNTKTSSSFNSQRTNTPNKLFNKAANNSLSGTYLSENTSNTNASRSSMKVIALEAKIEESSEITTNSRNKQGKDSPPLSAAKMFKLNMRNQQKKWWFYSETLERCVLAENVNGIDYAPLKLLSEGCYRLGGTEEMNVRCDDPPLGPQTYRFSSEKRICVTKRNERLNRHVINGEQKNRTNVKISLMEPVIEGQEQLRRNNKKNDSSRSGSHKTSHSLRVWHCMCYEEIVKGQPTLSTACRPTLNMCRDLEQKVKQGSSILVKDSTVARCQQKRGAAPWNAITGKGSHRYYWQPSSQPGAWWSAAGCFLPMNLKKKAKLASSKRRAKVSKVSNTKQTEIPTELYQPIGTRKSLIQYGEKGSAPRADKCAEVCRANLISSKGRQSLYGTTEVPPLLRWGKVFAERVKLVKTICMSNQSKGQKGREQCINKVINKCSIYCERADE